MIPGIAYRRHLAGITLGLMLSCISITSAARAQEAGAASLGRSPDAADTGPQSIPILDQLNAEIIRMRAEIAQLQRFSEWRENLMRIARSDPAEALRQRLPMSECRASALAPVCNELTGLFAPEPEVDEAGESIAPGTEPETEEGEQ